MPEPTREFLLQLLKDARITGPQLEEFAARAIDVDYWRALVPQCHVGGAAPSLELAPVDDASIDDAVRSKQNAGYFRLAGVIAPDGVSRLNAAIDAVIAAGWPPAFVFIYDEAWESVRSPAMRRLLESVLGPGFRQICHVWAHVVTPVVGASGWSPHTDGHTDSNPAGRISIWLGLTESTLDNGCMHVVPRTVLGSAPDLIPRFQTGKGMFTRGEVSSLLQGSHALMTSPGDALGWGFDIIHWGGFVRRTGSQRRAMSFEFISAGQVVEKTDGALTDMDALPAFDARLHAVATGVIAYRRFEPRVDRFADVAAAIKNRLPSTAE